MTGRTVVQGFDGYALFSLLGSSLPHRVFVKDRDSVYASCNENYASDLNIEPAAIAGKTDYDFYPRELAEKYRNDDRRIMERGLIEDIEESYIKEGEEYFVHTVKNPIKDNKGTVIGLLGVFWDITEQKKDKKSLGYEKDKIAAIFNSIEEVMYVSDPETCELLFVNDEFRNNWGDDILGKKCYSVLHKRDAPCEFCTNDRIFGENIGKSHVWEYRSSVNEKWYRCFNKAIPWSDGSMARFEIATDITYLKNIEDELKNHRDHLEKMVHERTEMLKKEIEAGKRREEIIARQSNEILELSTPVMKVWKGILAAPLIGSLDSKRTEQFMEIFLNNISETNAQIALVDITGVPTIDSMTAQNLIEAITAARLLGTEVILTGVRPVIAQTMVHLGIDLKDFETCSSMEGGLERALEKMNMRLVTENDNGPTGGINA